MLFTVKKVKKYHLNQGIANGRFVLSFMPKINTIKPVKDGNLTSKNRTHNIIDTWKKVDCYWFLRINIKYRLDYRIETAE